MADEGESTTWSFGDRRRSRPFSGEMGRRKHWKRPRFCFVGGRRPFYGGLEAWEGRRWEIGGERESRRREERDALRLATVWTRAWYTGTTEHCAPLDLGWNDRTTVIGWICRLIGRSGWVEVLIWCGAVYQKLGTPGDVAQRDQILNYFNGWDVLGYVWYFLICFFKKTISYSLE